MKRILRDAFQRWKDALVDQNKQTTQAARHRAHARVTSMEDLIAETPADDIEGIGSWHVTSTRAASIPRRQTARSNKCCRPTRIAVKLSVAIF